MNEVLLNTSAFQRDTTVVGPGRRDAIWVQGCSIRCVGCANQAYLDQRTARLMPVADVLQHLEARCDRIDGLSVLGGEPTEQHAAVTRLLEGVQRLGLSTVVFTGHLLEQLRRQPRMHRLLAATDLLIDGPYLASERDPTLHWRGSKNQRMHRLSPRFSEADLTPPKANGEITIEPTRATFNGVGTVRLGRRLRRTLA